MKYFSLSVYGFFDSEVHEPNQIPSDAIAISDTDYSNLADKINTGTVSVSDGKLVWTPYTISWATLREQAFDAIEKSAESKIAKRFAEGSVKGIPLGVLDLMTDETRAKLVTTLGLSNEEFVNLVKEEVDTCMEFTFETWKSADDSKELVKVAKSREEVDTILSNFIRKNK